MSAGGVRRGEIRARSAQWSPRMSLCLLTAVEGGEKSADLAGDLGDNLGLAARIGGAGVAGGAVVQAGKLHAPAVRDRKSTRLNSSHPSISYAVFCLKKKKKTKNKKRE